MEWQVVFQEDFKGEFSLLDLEVKESILASVNYLKIYGFNLGRPYVDTLKSSTMNNLKELRITVSKGEWRVAFAFDYERKAIVLVAGNKSGISQKLFYNRLISTAEKRFEDHLKTIKKG